MFDNYSKDQFFLAMEREGGFEGFADYAGRVAIIDDVSLENAWDQFVEALFDLQDIYGEWERAQIEV